MYYNGWQFICRVFTCLTMDDGKFTQIMDELRKSRDEARQSRQEFEKKTGRPAEGGYLSTGKNIKGAGAENHEVLLSVPEEGPRKAV